MAILNAEWAYATFTQGGSRNACAYHVGTNERLKSIPRHLLAAISKIESGRLNPDSKQIEAWPWTINVQGKGHYFTSKTEAVQRVKELMAQGIKSIDVGCMQINLHHHKSAFKTIEQAFDPKTNVDYAANFLSNLRQTHGSWTQAIAHYHSATPAHHIPYRKKVLDVWRKESRAPVLADQNPLIEASYTPKKKWATDYKAFLQGKRMNSAPVKVQKDQDNDPVTSQWQRHEARMTHATVKSHTETREEKPRPLLTATPNRRLRTVLIKGDRIENAKMHKTVYQNHSSLPPVYVKKPVIIVQKIQN